VLFAGNELVGNPESSGEDSSDSDDESAANGPDAVEHVRTSTVLNNIEVIFNRGSTEHKGSISGIHGFRGTAGAQ